MRRLGFILALAILAVFLSSKDAYAIDFKTEFLSKAAARLGISDNNLPKANEVKSFIVKSKNLNITTRSDASGTICHIGVKLFDEGMRAEYGTLVDFIEQQCLNHYLSIDEKSLAAFNGMFVKGNWDTVLSMDGNMSLSIINEYSRDFVITWEKNGKTTVEMHIPINIYNLEHATVYELEDDFLRLLPFASLTPAKTPAPGDLYKTDIKDIVRTSGNWYELQTVTDNLYYTRKKTLVCDTKYPEKTLANIMLTADETLPQKKVIANIGYDSRKTECSIAQLLNTLKPNHKLYFSVTEKDRNNICAVLYAVNEDYGYLHMFSMKVAVASVADANANITLASQLYVPINNETIKRNK